MDAITPVGAMIKPPQQQNALQTLSGILGLKQQQLALQQGQQQLQTQTAEASQAQQKNRELASLAQFAAKAKNDPAYLNSDGTPNVAKFQQDAEAIGGVYGAPVVGQMVNNFTDAVRARQTLQNLSVSENNQISGMLKNWASHPNPSMAELMDDISVARQTNHDPGFNNALDLALRNFQPGMNPAQLKQTAANLAATLGGFSQEKPITQALGGKIQPATENVFTGAQTPAGAPVGVSLAPTVVSNPLTNAPTVIGGTSGTGGLASPTMQPYPGEQADIKQYQNEVQATRRSADQAPLAHNINQEILALSSNAATGPGSDVWQRAIGALGAPFGLSPNASYQELGKFLEKNALANMQAMGGPPSDTRLEAAAAANGSTQFNPAALRAVTKFNDATTTALMAYRRGMDNYIGTRNPDYTKLPEFKKAWAKNFDVNVFLAENAFENHDTKTLENLRAQLGADGFKKLAEKRKNLIELEDGELPK